MKIILALSLFMLIMLNTVQISLGDELNLTNIGKRLFFTRQLSADGRLSCADCHVPALGYQDGYERALARTNVLPHNTPSLLNVAAYSSFFWDGRAATLQDQALQVITSAAEMKMSLEDLERLATADPEIRDVASRFGVPSSSAVVLALASYVGTLQTKDTLFSLWKNGEYTPTPEMQIGEEIFFGKGECIKCHSGQYFTDGKFRRSDIPKRRILLEFLSNQHGESKWQFGYDYGLANLKDGLENVFALRTPSLINVGITAPYMHDGTFRTLEEVVDYYARGEGQLPRLALSMEEKSALIAFLRTLTDVRYLPWQR